MKYWKLNIEKIQEMTGASLKNYNDKIIELVGDKKIIELIKRWDDDSVSGFKLEDGKYVHPSRNGMSPNISLEYPDNDLSLITETELKDGFLIECDGPAVKYYLSQKVEVLHSTDKHCFVRDGEDEYLVPVDSLSDHPPKGCLIMRYDLYPYYTVVKYSEIIDNTWFNTDIGKYALNSKSVIKIFPYEMYDKLKNERYNRRDSLDEITKSEGARLLSSGIYVPGEK